MPVDRRSVVFLPTPRAQAFISCSVCFALMPSIPLSNPQKLDASSYHLWPLQAYPPSKIQLKCLSQSCSLSWFLQLNMNFLYRELLPQPWRHRTLFVTHIETSHLPCIGVIYFMYLEKYLSFNKHLNDWVCNLSCVSPRCPGRSLHNYLELECVSPAWFL